MLKVSHEEVAKQLKKDIEDLKAEQSDLAKKLKKAREEAKHDNQKTFDKFLKFESRIFKMVQEQDEQVDLLSAKICTAVKVKNDLVACVQDIESQLNQNWATPKGTLNLELKDALAEQGQPVILDTSPKNSQLVAQSVSLSPVAKKSFDKKTTEGHRRPVQKLSLSTTFNLRIKSPTLGNQQINKTQHNQIV